MMMMMMKMRMRMTMTTMMMMMAAIKAFTNMATISCCLPQGENKTIGRIRDELR